MPSQKSRSFWRGATTPPHIMTLVLLSGTAALPVNIFLPVLPMISADLGTSDAVAQYVLTLFLGATAIAQLFIGPLSDQYGRRPVLLISLFIFIISSAICMWAPTIEILLFGRVLQAFSAAGLVLSRAIIRDLYDREKAASMIGYVVMAMAVLPMIAPTIGGAFGEFVGWRGPFYILFGSAIFIFIVVYFNMGETHTPNNNKLSKQLKDYKELLTIPDVWGYCLIASMSAGAYFAFLGGAPFVGSKLIGIGPGLLGGYFAIVAVGYIIGNFISGRFSQRIGLEPMMFYGNLFVASGALLSLLLMFTFEPKAIYLFGPMVFVGLGNGMVLPNAIAGAISVRPDLAGAASGLTGFMQIGGGALLASLSGNLINVENQALPLYIIMIASAIGAAIVSIWMLKKSRTVKQGL